jgi:VWFA-related protein
MRFCRTDLLLGLIFAAGGWAQTPPAATPQGDEGKPVFRTETRLVPVDVVVTDKKNNYVHNLESKDFKVWEDNKEQTITSFSFEADPASPVAVQKRYIVLFFDLSSMNFGDQMQARQAAVKFIDSTAGPNRLMAVVNYGGWLQIAQNFTDNIDRLKQIVSGVRNSAIVSNVGIGGPDSGGATIGRSNGEFGARSVLLALASLAKDLSGVPGRKTLILFSAGFRSDSPETISEITTTVAACNRANVAVYPVDVRGLATPAFAPRGSLMPRDAGQAGLALAASPVLRIAAFFAAPQRGTSGAGAGSGTSGGGAPSGGSSGAAPPSRAGSSGGGVGGRTGGNAGYTGNTGNPGTNRGAGGMTGNVPRGGGAAPAVIRNPTDPRNARGILIPHMPDSIATNQQVLYSLASGTGGFVIANTNDLAGGLDKINREQNEYYLLAYSPPESAEGSCHTIRVKANRGGLNLRARSGYCNVKSADLLAGKPVEQELASRLSGTQPGTLPAAPLQAPFFYTSPNTARVNVVLDLPTAEVKFQKVKGKQHAELNVLGIAYRPNGNVAARFSDTVKLDFDEKKQAEEFVRKPYHYENQFDAGAGQYALKIAFNSGGQSFGKVEMPLTIEPFDGKQFAVSGLALSTSIRRVSDLESGLDAEMLEGRVPLIASGFEFTPAGAHQFNLSENLLVYFEIYEPLLTDPNAAPLTRVVTQLLVLDRQSGSAKVDSGGVDLAKYLHTGNPVVPVGLRIPLNGLVAGAYRLEVRSIDSAGRATTRTTDFNLQ